ncbi:MAG: hypothetical protein ACYCWC_01935 [Rhodocyclaceae bacterium]
MPLYRLRHIDLACKRQYPEVIPDQTCGHAVNRFPSQRKASPGILTPARPFGMETQVTDHNLATKVGAGGTAMNDGQWRVAA